MLDFIEVPINSFSITENYCAVIQINASSLECAFLPGQRIQLSFNSDGENFYQVYALSFDETSKVLMLYIPEHIAATIPESTIPERIWLAEPQDKGISLIEPEKDQVIIADEVGFPVAFFLALQLKTKKRRIPFVILNSDSGFPFKPRPSQFMIPHLPAGVIASCPLLEDKKIPSRLVSDNFLPGCFDGRMIEFFQEWMPEYSKCNSLGVMVNVFGREAWVETLKEAVVEYDVDCAAYNVME